MRYYRLVGDKKPNLNGQLAEWIIAPVLKTGGCKSSVGSNPTLPAKIMDSWQRGLLHLFAKQTIFNKDS